MLAHNCSPCSFGAGRAVRRPGRTPSPPGRKIRGSPVSPCRSGAFSSRRAGLAERAQSLDSSPSWTSRRRRTGAGGKAPAPRGPNRSGPPGGRWRWRLVHLAGPGQIPGGYAMPRGWRHRRRPGSGLPAFLGPCRLPQGAGRPGGWRPPALRGPWPGGRISARRRLLRGAV